MRSADADGASYRTKQKRRKGDLDFLDRLAKAVKDFDLKALIHEADCLAQAKKKAPKWKVVAVLRAYGKLFGQKKAA